MIEPRKLFKRAIYSGLDGPSLKDGDPIMDFSRFDGLYLVEIEDGLEYPNRPKNSFITWRIQTFFKLEEVEKFISGLAQDTKLSNETVKRSTHKDKRSNWYCTYKTTIRLFKLESNLIMRQIDERTFE